MPHGTRGLLNNPFRVSALALKSPQSFKLDTFRISCTTFRFHDKNKIIQFTENHFKLTKLFK